MLIVRNRNNITLRKEKNIKTIKKIKNFADVKHFIISSIMSGNYCKVAAIEKLKFDATIDKLDIKGLETMPKYL